VLGTILYEDNHLLVIDKPAGIATQGSRPGERSLLALAKDYLKQKYRKPGNVFLAAVSRLDEFVSGVVVLARTSKSAARLSEQFASRGVTKLYLAVVEQQRPNGTDLPPSGRLRDWVWQDELQRRMVVVDHLSDEASEKPPPPPSADRLGGPIRLAESEVRILARGASDCLLLVRLLTGRKHQIRVQLASRGWPIVGDRKYGSRRNWARHAIALHALEIQLRHPTRGSALAFHAPPPPPWDLEAFGTDYSELVSPSENN
jgi:23S rRNA pseudouridine1911/1915/1917 synthase